ncbi:MAG: DUF63 family protein [Candidatus Micrarchaeota archaeon]|nr:DUF63 family protein [Candidatus Micrarchaeota archaeon]
MQFLEEYFLNPIAERTGYNIVNTSVYAAIALVALYLIWKVLKSRVDFSSWEFVSGVGAFVLFGSTARVLTDLADAGALAKAPGEVYAAANAVFAYSYLTVTPGIYLVVAALFFASLASGQLLKKKMFAAYAGIILWVPCFLLVLPFAHYWQYFILAALLAAAGSAAAFKALGKTSLHEKLAVFGQALDGAATFVIIDIFSKETGKSYFEQHVIPAALGSATPLGFFLFFLTKILLAAAIAHLLRKEASSQQERDFVLLVVAVIGFAPGLRDALRMLAGS